MSNMNMRLKLANRARQIAALILIASSFAITLSGITNAHAANATNKQQVTETKASGNPQATCPAGGQCFADVPSSNSFYDFVNRIYQQDLVSGYACGGAGEPCDAQSRPYYRPGALVTRQQMAKFIDNARRLPEIHIAVTGGTAPVYVRNDTGGAIAAYSTSGQALTAISSSQNAIYAQSNTVPAIYGFSTGSTPDSYGMLGSGRYGVGGQGVINGVRGTSTSGTGVYGTSSDGTGVYGFSANQYGVAGMSTESVGVLGTTVSGAGVSGESNDGDGVLGTTYVGDAVHGKTTGTGRAGFFEGNVEVTGTCCAMAAGTTRIDDPLDPANKTLNQSLMQSPDMLSVVSGNVTTGANGTAVVTLPAYFQAANKDFRYQLTPIGQFSQAIVSRELTNNTFTIETDKPNVKVSWQVTGVRNDPFAQAHPVEAEQAKPAAEQGTYLHPELYGQPASEATGSNK